MRNAGLICSVLAFIMLVGCASSFESTSFKLLVSGHLGNKLGPCD